MQRGNPIHLRLFEDDCRLDGLQSSAVVGGGVDNGYGQGNRVGQRTAVRCRTVSCPGVGPNGEWRGFTPGRHRHGTAPLPRSHSRVVYRADGKSDFGVGRSLIRGSDGDAN